MEEASNNPDSQLAEELFRELLKQPLLVQEQVATNVYKLLYLAHKNLGSVLRAQKRGEEAAQTLLMAAKLDSSDFLLWYNLGVLGLDLEDFFFAREAFETHVTFIASLMVLVPYLSIPRIGCQYQS